MNDHANWRGGTQDEIYGLMAGNPEPHPLLRNTIVGVFKVKDDARKRNRAVTMPGSGREHLRSLRASSAPKGPAA